MISPNWHILQVLEQSTFEMYDPKVHKQMLFITVLKQYYHIIIFIQKQPLKFQLENEMTLVDLVQQPERWYN